jgi:hypothetical protein
MRYQFVSVVGLFVLMTTGCLYHGGNPYGPYGAGPTVMPQQPWTGNPVGTYPSYNPYPAPVGTPYTPSNQPSMSQPTPIDSNTPPNTFKGGDNNTAPYNSPKTPSGNVPEPSDPPEDTNPSGSNVPTLAPTSNSSRSTKTNSDLSTPFGEETSTRQPRDFATDTAEVEDPIFESPVKQISHESDTPVPYGHSDRFDWLQGYVEYDEPTQTWVIIYTDNPTPSDKMGGEATLANHPALNSLRDGQIVRVEGSFDRSAKDSRNHPLFKITKLSKLPAR